VGQERENGQSTAARRLIAGAPISWGVCEVPGWGRMLPSERVLAEMASLGLTATELGPIGYLPLDPAQLRERLGRHGLRLASGFVPMVLHESSLNGAREAVDRIAGVLAAADAEVLVAAVVMDADWSLPVELDEAQWRRLVDHLSEIQDLVRAHGVELALHPHAGTLVQNAPEVERVIATTDVRWCLDTGHLVIGGIDPAEFVRAYGERIVHVHLKDVRAELAAGVRSGELSLVEAVRAGLFRPLGQGDAGIGEVVRLLDDHGYGRWLVLEQDTAIAGQEPPVGSGPVVDVKASIEYLNTLAPTREGER
jgi:inosose dehydratase